MIIDLAVGMLFGKIFLESSPYSLVLGAIFALLPDLDFIWHLLRSKEIAAHAGNPHDHRDGLHYPLVYIPAITLLCAIGAPQLIPLAVAGSLWHFVHDMIGLGWGIKWLWPFSPKNFKLFSNKQNGFSLVHPIAVWEPAELRRAIVAHGDPEYIQNLFVRPFTKLFVHGKPPTFEQTFLVMLEVVVPIIIIIVLLVN